MRTSQPNTTNNTGAHGLGAGLGAAAAQRLPVPPRERKPALAALAVILILGGALVSAYLVMASGQRVNAVSIAQPVAAGQLIPASALKQVQIGNTGIQFINWTERNKIVRSYAAVNLVPGTLLTNGMLAADTDAAKGRVVIGLALKPSQLPAGGLRLGDRVALYAVGTKDTGIKPGMILAADALVQYVSSTADRRVGSASDTLISVAVTPDQAPTLSQAASAGTVAVALVPPGTVVTVPQTVPTRAFKPGG